MDAAKVETKALVDAYIAANAPGMYAAALEVNTTQPLSFFSVMRVRKRCVMPTHATALHSTLAASFASGVWWKKPATINPALLNTHCTSIFSVAAAMVSR